MIFLGIFNLHVQRSEKKMTNDLPSTPYFLTYSKKVPKRSISDIMFVTDWTIAWPSTIGQSWGYFRPALQGQLVLSSQSSDKIFNFNFK